MKILKKILCICAVMCAVILFGTVDAKADTYGDYEYTVNDDGKTVTITKYNGSATDLTVPYSINGKKVTVIGNYAFYWCSSLVKVKLPSGLLDIQQDAFAICENMSQITLPSGLSSIGDSAFYSCESLTSITLPSSLKSIGGSAFWDCKVLSKLIIPANVSNVGNGIVAGCDALKSLSVDSNNKKYDSRGKCNAVIEKSSNTLIAGSNVTAIPSTVKKIGDDAFYECSQLSSVILPNGVTSIGEMAFYNCSNLTSVTIPNTVRAIDDDAFRWCEKLSKITLPDSVVKLGTRAFYNCNITSMHIPANVTDIGKGLFGYCDKLVKVTVDEKNKIYDSRNGCNAIIRKNGSVLIAGCSKTVIPDTVKCIGESAFEACDKLTSIVIPSSVERIDDSAFESCSNLQIVTMSNGVQEIGKYAFESCSSLTEITIPSSVTRIGRDLFGYKEKSDAKIYCEAGSTAYYYAIENGYDYYVPDLIDINDARVTGISGWVEYTGSNIVMNDIKVYMDEELLIEDIDYKVIYYDNCNIGIAKLKIIGIGKYMGSLTEEFIIEEIDISDRYKTSVSGIKESVTYTGKAITQPNIVVKYGDKVLVKNKDYTITYEDNIKVGTATVIIRGRGIYGGYIRKSFKIKSNITDISAPYTKTAVNGMKYSVEYTGKLRTFPKISVTVNGKTLTLDKDYTVKYSNNRNVGKAAVIITGKGMYTGTIKRLFNIVLVTGKTYTVNNMKYKVTKVGDNGAGTVALMGTTYSKTAKSFTSLTIGSTATIGGARYKVDAINENAFRDFRYLKKVVIGNNVRMVGSSAFKGCSSLNTLCIGSGVRLIGLQAFASCKNLKSISVSTTFLTSSSVGRNALNGIYSKVVIKVPASKLSAYKNLFRLRGVPKTAQIVKK